MTFLSNTEWGADSKNLLQIYTYTVIRSKLEYGSTVYTVLQNKKSYIQQFDSVPHQGLPLVLGVFRTSPIQGLYVEAKEPSLENRRLNLSPIYIIKPKRKPLNPVYSCVFLPKNEASYEAKPTYIRPLGLTIAWESTRQCGTDVCF